MRMHEARELTKEGEIYQRDMGAVRIRKESPNDTVIEEGLDRNPYFIPILFSLKDDWFPEKMPEPVECCKTATDIQKEQDARDLRIRKLERKVDSLFDISMSMGKRIDAIAKKLTEMETKEESFFPISSIVKKERERQREKSRAMSRMLDFIIGVGGFYPIRTIRNTDVMADGSFLGSLDRGTPKGFVSRIVSTDGLNFVTVRSSDPVGCDGWKRRTHQ